MTRLASALNPQRHNAAQCSAMPRKPVHLCAMVYPIDTFCNLHIKDISANGATGKACPKLAAKQTGFVTVDDQLYHADVVKWTDGREFGFSLPCASQIIGGHAESIDHSARQGHHLRATRTKISAAGRFVTGGLNHRATILTFPTAAC